MKKPLIAVVTGPTASGKTSLAIELAKIFDGEIISADSMQIYRGMDIATAKPTAEEMQGIPHHLISIIGSDETFSVNEFKSAATEAIDDILSRNKLPIVAGGTGFYIDTLVNNTEFLDFERNDLREQLEKRASQEGIDSLYNELCSLDPQTGARLHKNDTKRIIRALEVYYGSGKTISEQCRLSRLNESKYRFCIMALNSTDRQLLYDRINQRVDKMLSDGLVAEAENFFLTCVSDTARQAIGYKELRPYFDGLCTLEQAVDKLKMETRRYAKRQLTWLRKRDNINWIYTDRKTKDEIVAEAAEILRSGF